MREALSERLVDDVAAAEPTIAFPHALVREALIAGTGDAARARLHLAIARALEDDPDAEPAELARHYGLSVELAGPEPAIAAYRAAATAAAEAHDHEQAASHIQSACRCCPRTTLAERGRGTARIGRAGAALRRPGPRAPLLSRRGRGGAGDGRRRHARPRRARLRRRRHRLRLGGRHRRPGERWRCCARAWRRWASDEPRLALRMIFRLAYLLVFSDDDEVGGAGPARRSSLGSVSTTPKPRSWPDSPTLVASSPAARTPCTSSTSSRSVLRPSRAGGGMRPRGPAVPGRAVVRLRPLRAGANSRVRSGDRADGRDRASAWAAPASPGRWT